MIVFLTAYPRHPHCGRVRAEFDEETVALSLPGYWLRAPRGFGATKDDLRRLLITELESSTLRRPRRPRLGSATDVPNRDDARGLPVWTADIANGVHPNVQWHQYDARTCRPPVRVRPTSGHPRDAHRDDGRGLRGFPPQSRRRLALAQWSDDTMATCILDLYRSATPNVFASWGAQLAPTSAPGLILLAALRYVPGTRRCPRKLPDPGCARK